MTKNEGNITITTAETVAMIPATTTTKNTGRKNNLCMYAIFFFAIQAHSN